MTSDPKILVTRFYEIVFWNAQDYLVAEEILASEFKFRGSLGPELVGRDDFIDYAKNVHAGLSNYHCEIQKLIADETSCAARMFFPGTHTGEFLGYPASGLNVGWAGAAFFKCNRHQIEDAWVLGDLIDLHKQLGSRWVFVLAVLGRRLSLVEDLLRRHSRRTTGCAGPLREACGGVRTIGISFPCLRVTQFCLLKN